MTAIALRGAAVLVTGAARGIGRAAAEQFAAGGAHVCIGDLDGKAAAAAAAEIGSGAHGFALDVADADSFARFVSGAQEVLGRPADVLVNNAGIMPLGAFLEESSDTSRRTMEVNVFGVIHGMRLVLPGMVERGSGHVVNVASMMGKLHVPGAAVYGASKYAVVGLTAAVRDELSGTGVTVTAILPGPVRTDLITGVPLGRGLPVSSPEQVAAAIVNSCRNRPGEVCVPGWMAAYEPAVALAPKPLVGVVRRLVGHDRVLTKLDSAAREEYDARIHGVPDEE